MHTDLLYSLKFIYLLAVLRLSGVNVLAECATMLVAAERVYSVFILLKAQRLFTV